MPVSSPQPRVSGWWVKLAHTCWSCSLLGGGVGPKEAVVPGIGGLSVEVLHACPNPKHLHFSLATVLCVFLSRWEQVKA